MPTPADETVVDERIAIAVSTEHVWEALVDGATRAGWWSYLELDPRLGGRFEERWKEADGNLVRTEGQVLEIVEGRLLRLSWADESWSQTTEVEVRVEDADHGAWVRVRHTGWDSLPGGTTLAAQHRDGWVMHLENLRRHLEDRLGEVRVRAVGHSLGSGSTRGAGKAEPDLVDPDAGIVRDPCLP